MYCYTTIAVLLCILFIGINGQPTNWVCGSGVFSNASCWDSNQVPSPTSACQFNTANITVTFDDDGVQVASVEVNEGTTIIVSTGIIVNTWIMYAGTLIVTSTGTIAGNDTTAFVNLEYGFVSKIEFSGVVSLPVKANNNQGSLDIKNGATLTELTVSNANVNIWPGASIAMVGTGGTGTVTLVGPDNGIGFTFPSIVDTYGETTFVLTDMATLTIGSTFNITGASSITGNGTVVLPPASVSSWSANLIGNITVINTGYLQSENLNQYNAIELEGTSSIQNQGTVLINGGIYLNDPTTSFINEASGIIEQGNSQNSYSCFFLGNSADSSYGLFKNVGTVNCNTLSLSYINVITTGTINSQNFYFQFSTFNVLTDLSVMNCTGAGTVVFGNGISIGDLAYLSGTSMNFQTAGNVTIVKFSGNTDCAFSGVGSKAVYTFGQEFTWSAQTTIDVTNCTIVFLPNCLTTSTSAIWNFQTGVTVYQQGTFNQIYGYFTLGDPTVTFINQGTLSLSGTDFSYDASTTLVGNFFNVGITKIDGTFDTYANFATCNGGNLVFVFGGASAYAELITENRVAIDGSVSLQITSTWLKSFTTYAPLISFGQSLISYPNDFNNGFPSTIQYHHVYDVHGAQGDTNTYDDISACFSISGSSAGYIYIISPTFDQTVSCVYTYNGTVSNGMCDGVSLPPATVTVPNAPPDPPYSAPSSYSLAIVSISTSIYVIIGAIFGGIALGGIFV